MNIDYSVYWDVERSVGAEVVRVNGGRVESDIFGEVGNGDCEGFELEVGSNDDISVDKGVKICQG